MCGFVAMQLSYRPCDPQSAPSLCWTLPHQTPRGPAPTAEVHPRCQAVRMRLQHVPPNHISTHNEAFQAGMAGDVNLFFNDRDGDMSTAEIEVRAVADLALRAGACGLAVHNRQTAMPLSSVQVMIAEKDSRRRGLAVTALQMLMAYASQDLVSRLPCVVCRKQRMALPDQRLLWSGRRLSKEAVSIAVRA